MRVSSYYGLGLTQPQLDFVDVDVERDTPLFLSPSALAGFRSEWAHECIHLVQNYFEAVLADIRSGRHSSAESLLRALKEPNETHLGLSKGLSRGRALGERSAHDVWGALSRSNAAKSGLLRDLEDTVLMIDGIDVDIVSDMTTNIIRGPLIRYTQDMCKEYGIPLVGGVATGPKWSTIKRGWEQGFSELPVTDFGKLLLVPKVIVRKHVAYDAGEYYRMYLLEHLRDVELEAGSSLVEILKNKKRRVTKVKLQKKYGTGKAVIVRETLNYPEILEKYRAHKSESAAIPMQHEDIAEVSGRASLPNWDDLLRAVVSVPVGNEKAPEYEKTIEALLSALFYPDLCYPQSQHKLHDGRKRVDITYANSAKGEFFGWVAKHYPAAYIFVECKNYGTEVGNPEIDQLSGRFSPSRGQVGLLVCRDFKNRKLLLQRCRDTASDRRGFILAVDDGDLTAMVQARKNGEDPTNLLRARFDHLLSNSGHS